MNIDWTSAMYGLAAGVIIATMLLIGAAFLDDRRNKDESDKA